MRELYMTQLKHSALLISSLHDEPEHRLAGRKYGGRSHKDLQQQILCCSIYLLYCDNTNRNELENIDFYLSYNFFRLAGILQGIIGRVRDGTAASEHAEERANRVRPLAEFGWLYAQRAGAV